MSSFLMQYNRRTGDLAVTEFSGEDARHEALQARVRAEVERTNSDIEVVVLAADSLEDIKETHGRYFLSAPQLAQRALDYERRRTAMR